MYSNATHQYNDISIEFPNNNVTTLLIVIGRQTDVYTGVFWGENWAGGVERKCAKQK